MQTATAKARNKTRIAHYAKDGTRLTDCCAAYSTFHMESDGSATLCCKKCWCEVPFGQGDGSERREATKEA